MAALQKIRNHGVLLVTVIAVALFLFVMGDLVRGGEGLLSQSKQQVGEVLGQTLSIQDYNDMVNDLQNYYEIIGQDASGEDQLNRIKDEAWQTYVQNKLIQDECKKLGIQVTDEEVAQVIQTGQSQLLQVPIFANPETGVYDFATVQKFLADYKTMKDAGQQLPDVYEKAYKFYLFAQRSIRDQLFSQKYQVLMMGALTSNSVSAKQEFADKSNVSDLLVASFPFSSVDDKDFNVTDAEIKAKYEEHKELYKQLVETRDIKYISVTVLPSDADKKASQESIEAAQKQLAAAETNELAGNVVRQNVSLLPYSNVLKSKDAFPAMIADKLDSVAVGETAAAEFDLATNCYYTFRVLDKAVQADSVLFRQIGIAAETPEKVAEKADSIVNALNAGAKFTDIAKIYGQTGDSSWVSTASFEKSAVDADNALFISSIYSTGVGATKQVKLSNGNIIVLQVLDEKNPISKYNVATILKESRFSDDTYNAEYNKLSSFLAANKTLDQMEKNAAKSGYQVLTANDVISSNHIIANISGTHDALKWVFDEADINGVSPLYECGENDHLLVAALTGINKAGYRSVEKLSEELKQEVLNDKKAEKLLAQLKDVKSIEAASGMKGAAVDSLKGISFAAAPFIMSAGAQEPVIGAAAAKTALGAVSAPVKGNAGVYLVKVLANTKSSQKFDAKAEKSAVTNNAARNVMGNIINTLYLKADVKDNRYKFF